MLMLLDQEFSIRNDDMFGAWLVYVTLSCLLVDCSEFVLDYVYDWVFD